MGEIKMLSLFSGIGAFEMALRNIGVEYDLLGGRRRKWYNIKSDVGNSSHYS